MFVLQTKYDHFRHRVGDLDTLEDILYGLTDNMGDAKRVASIAKYMNIGDGFATDGIMLTCEEDANDQN